jgi:hypothetical protein
MLVDAVLKGIGHRLVGDIGGNAGMIVQRKAGSQRSSSFGLALD